MNPQRKDQNLKLRNLLRKLRKDKNLRQVDLAKKLSRHQSFISKYESGEKTLDFFELREVCDALDLEMKDFLKIYDGKME